MIGWVVAARPVETNAGKRSLAGPEPRVLRHISFFAAFAALFSVAVGFLSTIGLKYDIALLKITFPGVPVITMNAAVCLVLLGISLWLVRNPVGIKARCGRIISGIVALVGLLSLVEHLFGRDLGIDRMLFRDPATNAVFGARQGLIAPIAAADFLLLGLVIIVLDRPLTLRSRRYWPTQYFVFLTALLPIVALLDFALGSHTSYTHVAPQTAVTLLFLSLGLLCIRPERGLAALIASSTSGGSITRRLLPAAVIVPAAIGAISWNLLAAGGYSQWGAVSLMMVVMSTLVGAVVIWNGYIVDRGDLERVRSEAILQRRELELREAQRLAQMGSWSWKPGTDRVIWSEGLSHLAQRDPLLPPPGYKEHLGFYTSESSTRLAAAVERSIETGDPYELDLELVRADGAVRQVAVHGEAERGADGRITRVRGSVLDITERKQSEDAMRKSVEEASDLYNNAACGYHSVDADGIFVRVNDTELEWLQYRREEVIGKRRFSEFLTAQGLKTFEDGFRQLKTKGAIQDLDFDLVRRDGSTFPVLVTASAITDPAGNYLMSRSTVYDVTERRREGRSRAQLAAIVEYSDDAIISKALDERILTWNKGAERIFGYTAQEMVGQTIEAIVPADQAQPLRLIMQKLVQGESTEHLETTRVRKDGVAIDVALTISPIRDADGRVVGAATISRDITDRKRSETEIRLLARRQTLVAALGQQALQSDELGKILNDVVAQLAQILDVDYARVLELLPDGRTVALRAGVGWNDGKIAHTTVVADSLAGFTLMYRKPVVIEDLRTERVLRSVPIFGHPDVTSAMSVVVPTSSGPYGILSVDTRRHRKFTSGEVDFLRSIANVLGNMVERRRAEGELQRVTVALRALSTCNEALVRATDEGALLHEICRIIAECAGYLFCWVGHAEQDEAKNVLPIAKAGFEEGYLETVNISWADEDRGHGPTGTCIRTGMAQLSANIESDATFAPWQPEASKRGYAACVAIPIVVESNSFGALTIYSGDTAAFGAEEVKLLTELVNDLGFGLTTLRTRAERIRAEEEIRRLNAALERRVTSRTAELQTANRELEQAREREMEIGFKIQQTLLLDQPPVDVPGLRVAALTIPSQRIDGDFYIFIRHSDECLDVIVGDVMGKGIPAALLGAATKSHFLKALSDLMGRAKNGSLPEPKEIVMVAHGELVRHLIDLDSFVTLVYARFDGIKRSLELVDCGHTGTVHLHSGTGLCEMIHGDNLPLGVREGEIYDQISVPFEPGDLFTFFSDGITEARSAAGVLYGAARLEACVAINGHLQPIELVEAIRKEVFTYSEASQLTDDLTVVAVKVEERQLPIMQADIEIVSDLKCLRDAREFVRGFCRGLLDEDGSGALELAVNEAASNVMIHAYQGRSDQRIHLEAEAFPSHVTIRLHHLGDPFDPSTVAPPSLDGSRESGFGAYLISKCVDDVRYYRDERGRNCIALVKLRKSPDETPFRRRATDRNAGDE